MSTIRMRTAQPGELRGVLSKQRRRLGGFVKRTFVRRGSVLQEFDLGANSFVSVPRRIYDLVGGYVEDAAPITGKPASFTVHFPSGLSLTLLALSVEDKQLWSAAIREGMVSPATAGAGAQPSSRSSTPSSRSTTTASPRQRAQQQGMLSPPPSPLVSTVSARQSSFDGRGRRSFSDFSQDDPMDQDDDSDGDVDEDDEDDTVWEASSNRSSNRSSNMSSNGRHQLSLRCRTVVEEDDSGESGSDDTARSKSKLVSVGETPASEPICTNGAKFHLLSAPPRQNRQRSASQGTPRHQHVSPVRPTSHVPSPSSPLHLGQPISLAQLSACQANAQVPKSPKTDYVEYASKNLGQMLDLLESFIDAVVVGAIDGRIVAINSAAARMFGLGREAARGTLIKDLMPEPMRSRHDSFLFRHEKFGTTNMINQTRAVKACHSNGTVFSVEMSLGHLHAPGYYMATFRLVTSSSQNAESPAEANLSTASDIRV